ncbi:HU family DNA-binding protein [Thermoanaerobacterium sp. DL9XJH110]|jgi:DNA-binding protein HU-beta|uniref:HU family DNA-binding protein n=1 Tax=Thermoanaerobacterium sp. DL9XJH110 TaxID=3386643 RepID=UPI003BB4DEC7
MNKAELVAAVAEKAGMTQKDTARVINEFINVVSEAMSKREIVRIVNFGTFKVRERAARTGRNPVTGKKMQIPARAVPVFTPGKMLKKST